MSSIVNVVRLLLRGVIHLVHGEFDPVRRFVKERFIEPLRSVPVLGAAFERYAADVSVRRVESPPPFVGDVAAFQVRESSGSNDTYRRVIDDTEVRIDPPFCFNEVLVPIVDIRESEAVTVEIEFELTDGSVETTTTEFRDGSFNDAMSVPISRSASSAASAATVTIDVDRGQREEPSAGEQTSWTRKTTPDALLGAPSLSPINGPDVPVFLISVDTFRYDYLDAMEELIEVFEGDAVVPEEPRTQGISTWPSHATMLSSVHPGTHGCYSGNFGPQISTDLSLLPEVLEEQGYTCSACVSSPNLAPEIGYGRGFHRYELQPMDWKSRQRDCSTVLDTTIEWVRQDARRGTDSVFYFAHVFDGHYPYVPPLPETDISNVDYAAMDKFIEYTTNRDYLELTTEDPISIDPDLLSLVKEYYRSSLEYVGSELADFVATLKRQNMYEDSLIIVTGDHGEDFFERNFLFHNSLLDANIRPGLIVKPPADSDLDIPDDANTIDFYPTIANAVGVDVPNHCRGSAWVPDRPEEPRITERLLDTYNVSVERDGVKGIFTCAENNPDRPPREYFEDGFEHEEYYTLDGKPGQREREASNISETTKSELRATAKTFIEEQKTPEHREEVDVSDAVEDRLSDLGYT